MFNLFGKKPKAVSVDMRDTLYGDYSLEEWPGSKASTLTSEPWSTFVQARDALNKGKKSDAVRLWQQIAEMPDLESRHYVQAWQFLRQQGVQPPPEKAKFVYGVVAEVPVKTGMDLLAAYLDGSARYYNYAGAGVVWEKPDSSLDAPIKALLTVGQKVVERIGPWEGARPPLPPGQTRITMLTPSGLCFGQGKFEQLNADPMGKFLIGAATNLMVKMTDKALKRA